MAVLDRSQYFDRVRSIVGDRHDDDSIHFIEDMADTYESLSTRSASDIDWEKKYHENDQAWAERYRSRFFTGSSGGNPGSESEYSETKTTSVDVTIDDLFKED